MVGARNLASHPVFLAAMLLGALLFQAGLLKTPSGVVGDLFASSVAGLGDVNGDGHADVATVVCSWGSDFGDDDEPGPGVAAFSGLDGKLLWTGAVGLHVQRFCNRSLRPVGDVDGDGCADLAFLSLRRSILEGGRGSTFALVIAFLSGRDGSILRSFPVDLGLTDPERAEIACVGDVDGDSIPDLAVVASTREERSAAWIQSCGTGEILRWFDRDPDWWMNADGLESAGDFDADGHADLAVLAYARSGGPVNPYEPRRSAVVVRSGVDGKRLLVVETPGNWFQVRFCGAGDVDCDGHPDLALAGHASKPRDTATTWEVQVRSGLDGRPLRSIQGILEDVKCGDIACVGDVDQDGATDILISEFMMLTGGIVRLHSGNDGSRLRDSEEPARKDDVSEYFGYAIAAAGDVDADGVPDWVAGQCSPWGDMSSRMVIVSGQDGRAIHSIDRRSLHKASKSR